MNNEFDFAVCRCGHPTPIRPSKRFPQEDDQKWLEQDDPFVVVACSECKRVYIFETAELKPMQTLYGISPYNPEAPMHAFREQLRCDVAGCKTPLEVIVIRSTNTSAEALQQEKADWWWEDLTCPKGHALPDRKKAER